MPSGIQTNNSNNHFTASYTKPWGGVASDSDPVDIAPNQMVIADGVSIRNGALCYANVCSQNSNFDLELIPPPDQPPYGGGTSGYVSFAISTGPIFPNGDGSYSGLRYERIDGTHLLPTDFVAGTSFEISGSSNPFLNGGQTVAAILSTEAFYASQYSDPTSPLDGTGTLTYFSSTGGGGGAPSQSWAGAYLCLIFNCGNYLCAVDQFGFSYIATKQTDGTIKFQVDKTADIGPTVNFGIPTAVKVINGVAYISIYSKNRLMAYTPKVSYVTSSTYTAGQFLAVFDEYLIQLNTNSATDGIKPSRINWSAPDQFNVWDPSVNRLAGFQSLTTSEDYISGFASADNVGYIFKREGITQITAAGLAIQPFTFTTFWTSVVGQGLIFPYTLIQYGRFIFLATDSNIYIFLQGTFHDIGTVARQAIYASFNQKPPLNAAPNSLISAGFSVYPFNDKTPGAEYIFQAATSAGNGNIVFWFYSLENKSWTSITRSINSILSDFVTGATGVVINSIKNAQVFLNYVDMGVLANISNLPVNLFYINFTYVVAGVSYTKTFCYFLLVNTPTADLVSITPKPNNLNLVFRQEEFKLGQEPTVRRILILANGSGDLHLKVGTVDFGTITLDGTQVTKTYYSPKGVFTNERPQLSITSTNFIGRIVKVLMLGAYTEGETY